MHIFKDPKLFIKHIKRVQSLKIFVNDDIISLCSLKILSTVLTKEYIKHEIIFISNSKSVECEMDHIILNSKEKYVDKTLYKEKENDDIKENIINQQSSKPYNINQIIYSDDLCECEDNQINLLINMYKLVRSLNMTNEINIWAMIVGYFFYKTYLAQDFRNTRDLEDSSEELDLNVEGCNECMDTFHSLIREIKNFENILFSNELMFPLIEYSNLYLSMKHDFHFLTNNKLINRKGNKHEDYKINEYLAKKGICILKSKEQFRFLDHATRKYFQTHLDKTWIFIRKKGHTHTFTAIDDFLIINYYLIKGNPLEAYLVLDGPNRKITDLHCEIYKLLDMVKKCMINVQKIRNMLIFKFREFKEGNHKIFIEFAYLLIGIYKNSKFSKYQYIVVIEKYTDNKAIVYGKDIYLGDKLINGAVIYDTTQLYKDLNK